MMSSCARGTYWTSLLIQDASITPMAVGKGGALSPFHRSLSSLTGPYIPTLLLISWHLETISTTGLLLCAMVLLSLPSSLLSSLLGSQPLTTF